jgi:uncharacterized protein
MTRIGLISDTHSYLHPRVMHHFKDVDEIWHAGDVGDINVLNELEAFKPVRAVYGNIDGTEVRMRCPEDVIFTSEGLKVFMTHIGGYPGHYTARARQIIMKERPGLFICGHSHILKVIPDPALQLLHINPGAAGNQGWHKVMTLVRFSIEQGKIKTPEVIELGSRGQIM